MISSHRPNNITNPQFKLAAIKNALAFMITAIVMACLEPNSLIIAIILAKQGTNIVVIVTAVIH
jgi:hypothetical protein